MNSSTLCVANGDIAFGPQVEPCLRDFDFTLQFENLILSVLPSALFLLIAPVRIWSLRGQRKRVGGSTFQLVKLFTIGIFGVLQLSLLVLWCLDASERTPASIAAATLSLVDAFTFCILSYAEHGRSIRPSMVLGSFLFFSLLFDIVRVRTLWLIGEDSNTARLFTTSVVLKAGILILEAKEKRDYLNDQDKCRGPEELSGVFSQGVFYWLNHLVTSGYRKVLSLEDLYPLDDQLTAPMLQGKLSKSWERSLGNTKHRLFLDTLRAFKWELFAPVVPRLFLVAFTFGQPILLNTFIDYLQDSNASDNIGYGLIGAYGFTYLGLAVSTGFYYHRVYRFVTMVRGALVTVIYRKTTEISITALDNSAAVTLMSADVERICQGLRSLHEFWANLIQVGIATYLLRQQLGSVACIAPVLMAIVSGVGAFSLSGGASKRQGVWMKAIQKRVGVTSAMLSSMKGVKMAGLTEKLSEIIQSLRLKEVASAIRFRMMLIYNVTIAFVPMHLSPVITFGAFVAISRASGQSLDTARMFTSISLLTLLSQPLSQVFLTIPKFVAALGCFQRIQVFMLSDTKSDHRLRIRDRIDSEVFTLEPEYGYETIELQPTKTTSANADNHAIIVENGTFGWNSTDVLKDITFSIGKSQLTMLIGPVACGKSTILKALLGETPSSQGFVYVESKKVAFCDQTPWLKNGTVQKNILGFSLFDGPWYNSVINACGLQEDLATFPLGDQSLIGSKGITLSGGQKQRIAIARAVYSRTNVVFLDDVFSGMDATTEQLVFSRLLGPQGLLRQQRITVVIATHAVNLLPSADYIIVLGPRGDIIEQGTFNQLNKSNGYVQSFKVQHAKKSSTPDEPKPGFLALGQTTASPLIDAMDEKKRQLGDLSVYAYYFKILGKRTTAVFLFFAAGYGFLMSFPTVWLKWWADANAIQPNQNLGMYFGVYSLLQTITLIFVGLTVWQAFTTMVVKSGIKLHWTTLKTVTSAPMALFSMVDAGVLLNRFSQDIELIDDELPSAVMNSTGSAFICIGQAILIATASFYIALVYPFIAAVFYFLQKFYLRTSRQLRFMDLEAKSPLYTQFIESLSGLSTIRAFGWQKAECDLNHELLDASQKPFYLLYMIQRWLTLVLDLITMSLALVITGLAVALRHSASPGFTGVALVNVIGFNITLQSLIIWWTTLETSIGAVSRVKTFQENTDSEDLPGENDIPPENWPTHGRVEFRNVSASYKSDEDKALHNISSTFYPGEKVGICGRSGSGKSTFILSLFRLLPLSSGSILIDNIDISTLPRELHRSRLNAIPQEPYFLAGTIRLNLDPYSHSTDPDLHTALQKVKLDTVLPNLDSEMDPESLSHGQRQLFCLARAILRKGKIVVLDEATSSVDRKTDALMQRIIREEFKDRTIIAVAHRLDTILDFDRIVVLDRGILVECDSPEVLLKKERGAFKALWEYYSSGRKEDGESASASPSGSKSGSASDAEGGI